MRLLELRANKESFHTIKFNEKGISLIVGRRENQDNVESKKTYNSVGKSLSVRLVHFCLACNEVPEFSTKLQEWIFELDFIIGDSKYTSRRSTDQQNKIYLNNKEMKLADFRDEIGSKVFQIPSNIKYLTFRSLISRFIRPKKSSYVSYDNFVDEEQTYNCLLNNSFLLGLDVLLVSKKYDLKEEHDKVEEMKSHIEKDDILKAFFEQGREKDVEIEIVDLEQKIKRLDERLRSFVVAEDYEQIKKDADEISAQLRVEHNKAAVLRNAIRNIDLSLELQPDLPKDQIIQMYQEAKVVLGENIVRRLEEVESFNKKLITNRKKRLLQEKKTLDKRLGVSIDLIQKHGREEDRKLQYLNTHGALEEYSALNVQLADFRLRLGSIQTYKKLLNEYKNRLEVVKNEFGNQNIITNNYLSDNESLVKSNIEIFMDLAKQFYESKKAGIEVKNNEGVNQQRFEINAKIQDDAGDGVNEVKIFCFDWTLLKGRHNHSVEFLFHDSRLLSDMDPRQKATLMKIAHEQTIRDGTQYIISANEDQLQSMQQYLGEEYSTVIENNIILSLTDGSDASRLLGIQVDLKYEDE